MKFLLDHDVPEDLSYLIEQLGHDVTLLRKVLPEDARDDFLTLAAKQPHHGIIVVIRRRSRAAERAVLFRLLERAGETAIHNNVTFG